MARPRLAFTVESRQRGAREARALLRTWLTARSCAQDAIETAELLVTEVVSNALRHTDSAEVDLTVHLDGRRIRVEVGDGTPVGPPAAPCAMPRQDDEGGRGLWLIERMADAWGWHPDRGGKKVWFELTCSRAEPVLHEA